MTASNKPQPKLEIVQVMRGVAAMLIVLLHALHEVSIKTGASGLPANYPYTVGVDIFFVISGFVMMYTSRERFGEQGAWKDFMKRRLVRIVPLYWFYTTLVLFIALLMPSVLDTIRFEPMHVLLSYLFIPHVNPAGTMHPFLDLGWTLNYEMYFYIVFAAFISLPMGKAISALLYYFIFTAAIGMMVPPGLAELHFWTRPIILEFAAGAFIGWLFLKNVRVPDLKPAVVVLLLVVLGLVLAFIPGVLPRMTVAVAAIALVTLPKGIEYWSVPKWLGGLGDASYTIYLSHPFVIGALTQAALLFNIIDTVPSFILLLFCVTGAGAGGYILYRIVEKPLLSLTKHVFLRPEKAT